LAQGSGNMVDSRSSGIPRRLVWAKSDFFVAQDQNPSNALAAVLHMPPWAGFEKLSKERAMDGDYVFLCGVMWCCYGHEDAGRELLRAADSADPDLSALALAMLRQSGHSLHQHTA
jgi:hypothetical protein